MYQYMVSEKVVRWILPLVIFASMMLTSSCVEIDEDVHFCTEEQRDAEACTREYDPVCGWYKEDVECKSTPCAETASNPCEACRNPDVEFWTKGECPEDKSL